VWATCGASELRQIQLQNVTKIVIPKGAADKRNTNKKIEL